MMNGITPSEGISIAIHKKNLPPGKEFKRLPINLEKMLLRVIELLFLYSLLYFNKLEKHKPSTKFYYKLCDHNLL